MGYIMITVLMRFMKNGKSFTSLLLSQNLDFRETIGR